MRDKATDSSSSSSAVAVDSRPHEPSVMGRQQTLLQQSKVMAHAYILRCMIGLVFFFHFSIELTTMSILPNGTESRTIKKYLGYYLAKISQSAIQINGVPMQVLSNAPFIPTIPIVTNGGLPVVPGPPPTFAPQAATTLLATIGTFSMGTTPATGTFSQATSAVTVGNATQATTVSTPSASAISSAATISPDTAPFPSFAPNDVTPSATIGPPPGLFGMRLTSSDPPDVAPSPFPTTPPNRSSATASGLPTGLTNGVFLGSDLQSLAQGLTFPGVAAPVGPQQCSCVPAGTCVSSTGVGGRIDLRIVTQNPATPCAAGLQYCCTQGTNTGTTGSCGTQNMIAGLNPVSGQANLGEFPWSGIIINSANQYVGGAALIDSTHLLTAAHLVSTYGNGAGLRIRLGEWDLTGTYEPFAAVDIPVLNIVTHPQYQAATLQNDLAVITLTRAPAILTNPTPQINTVCLPLATDVFTGQTCSAAGWGRDSFTGNYQNIIKQVDIAIMGSADCQQRLQRTKLGANWRLDTTSFICAGGEANRDSCTGDGGNALVCQRNGRFFVAGITAGGVECGLAGVPGLYVNIASYLNWIQTITGTTTTPAAGNLDPRNLG